MFYGLTHNTNKDRSTFISTAGGQQCAQPNSSLGLHSNLNTYTSPHSLSTKAHDLAGWKPPRLPLGLAFNATIRRHSSLEDLQLFRETACVLLLSIQSITSNNQPNRGAWLHNPAEGAWYNSSCAWIQINRFNKEPCKLKERTLC